MERMQQLAAQAGVTLSDLVRARVLGQS